MKPKPMTFTPDNVRKLMADPPLKTQSRRIIKPQPEVSIRKSDQFDAVVFMDAHGHVHRPPHQRGDIVYVAEGYRIYSVDNDLVKGVSFTYTADNKRSHAYLNEEAWKRWDARKHPYRKTPGRFMYSSLARTYRLIKDVRAERIQDISEEDARAEGCSNKLTGDYGGRMDALFPCTTNFIQLWNSIHGPDAWDRDDRVFAYTLEQCEKPE